jgi:phage terminase large subunit-like protein
MLDSTPVAPSRADLVIAFIEEYLFIPEGKDVGKPVRLRPWQKDIIRQIYEDGVTLVIISMARKNAKTALIAMLLAAHICGPVAVPNSQLYSAAQSRDQASVVFNLLRRMILFSPQLNDLCRIVVSTKQVICERMGTEYRALSADATTAHGLSPVFVVHDELGQVVGPTSLLYEALETAMGAQVNPLSLVISTQARTNEDLLSVLIDDAVKGVDPSVRLVLYSSDPVDDDPWSEETWRKANPALGDFRSLDDVRRLSARAKRMPSQEPGFRNLILNQRVAAHSLLFSPSVWGQGSRPIDNNLFMTEPVYGGLDLSSRQDLTCLCLCAIDPMNGEHHFRLYTWTPGMTLRDREATDRQPYSLWVKQGHMTVTAGNSIDYDDVAEFTASLTQIMDLRVINFDRWRIDVMKKALERVPHGSDVYMEPFGQGYASMSPAIDSLETLGLNGKLVHGDNPVLTMCMSNAVVVGDPSGNRKFDKSKSTSRIDGVVAMVMALAAAQVDVSDSFDVSALIG